MVLEATMIVVDNSESSRNGDYFPTRWEAQADTVKTIFDAKTESNPESSVGLMSMGGKGPEVLVTLTTDLGKVLAGLHRTKIRGQSHLYNGIQVAGLALKHRQNKSQRQRIVVFTCSPIHEEEKQLVTLAKKMRKSNVSIDFVAFGDLAASDTKKLESFNENVNSNEGGSHLAVVPPGPSLLSDQILGTPIIGADGVARGAGGADGDDGMGGGGADAGAGFEFGVDPSADPELALALRMSMEEEKARQDKENKAKEEAAKKESLENIPEEGQPLLDKEGEPSGSGEGRGGNADGDKKDEPADEDKMDTA